MNKEKLRDSIGRRIFPVLNLKNEAYEVDTRRALGLADQILSIEPLDKVFKLLDLTRDKCLECGGYGTLPSGTLDEPEPDIKCPACQGTGRVGDWHTENLVIKE